MPHACVRRCRARRDVRVPAETREGLGAYAARQAAMLRGLGTQGAALWKKTLACESRDVANESVTDIVDNQRLCTYTHFLYDPPTYSSVRQGLHHTAVTVH